MADTLSYGVSQAIQVYVKGTKAWFEDEEEAWVSSTVVSKEETDTGVKIVFEDDRDSREHVFESTFTNLEAQKGANLPPLRNPPKLENIEDLTNLSYLNEPSVLNTIRTRYLQRHIYTYSGIVLIAANPFARVALYEPEVIQQYSGQRRGELEPHLFAIAEDAYRCMVREKTNQTVVVSGESGAGKTVSATHIMRYFATADDAESGKIKNVSQGMTEVEEQIMATNPIMEAFGNAKTTRNNNSSRFGKYIEIQFDNKNNIVGAKIRTYLLERSRLIFQPETERNYHIFYQLCVGAPISERKKLEIGDWSKFHYLSQSGTGTIPGVDDAAEFELTQKSLSLVGIAVEQQWQIFQLLAALLHIGNIEIGGRTDASIADDQPALNTTANMLGIKQSEFKKWLTRRQIITRNEKIVKNLSVVQALVVRDSVAKYIYASLFDWLVKVVNDSLSCQEEGLVRTFIGVLDIYGFEHFKKNSFEQFCINYANEKLQQQFNQHVFKLEQEEYVKEKIDWNFIEFSDNQKCIEVIESKLGILSLLDEESRLPSGTDQGFCNKLYSNFSDVKYKNCFKKPRFSNSSFTVVHYAHEVEYDSEGFIDKNKDTVPDELLNLLQTAESPFLVEMLQTATAAATATSRESNPTPVKKAGMAVAKKPTLGSIFKQSLISLMETINLTNVHYIRCIKPNEAKVAWGFEPNMVLSQLRACGVLETIRISCLGYPSRWSFPDFAERFYALVSSIYWDPNNNPDMNELCRVVLEKYIPDKDKYQIGLTKIFFRAGQLAYLEKCRKERWEECTILLQKNMRRFIVRIRYLNTLNIISRLQRVARQKMGAKKLQLERQTQAIIKIQAQWRRSIQRRSYLNQIRFVTNLQTACRSYITRLKFSDIRKNLAAIKIQSMLRGWTVRKEFNAKKKHVVALQTCIRLRLARQRLQSLKREAKSANHFKEVSYKLESKVVELTQMVTLHKEEKRKISTKADELEVQVNSWKEKYEKLDVKSKDLEQRLNEPNPLEDELESVKSERDILQNDQKSSQERIKKQEADINRLGEDVARQKEEIFKLKQQINQQQLKSTVNSSKPSLVNNNDSEIQKLNAQIVHLKAKLNEKNLKSNTLRGLSQHSDQQSTSPDGRRSTSVGPRPVSPSNTLHHSPISPNSTLHHNSVSSNGILHHNSFTLVDNKTVYAEPKQLLSKVPSRQNSLDIDLENAIDQLLQENSEEIEKELVEDLVNSLIIVKPNIKTIQSKEEVFFPVHIICRCIVQMWRSGHLEEANNLLLKFMIKIQETCNVKGEKAFIKCSYWLSNLHELLSLLFLVEQEFEIEIHYNSIHGRRAIGWHDFEKHVHSCNYELHCLEDNIYAHFLVQLKEKLNKIVIPAVIESQVANGYHTKNNSRFFGGIFSNSQPQYNMDDLLNFLNDVNLTLNSYHANNYVIEQVTDELFKMIGVVSFNNLIMRRGFNSWKRSIQIMANLTRLYDWCESKNLFEATANLEYLKQAVGLLQHAKSTVQDINNIYNNFWFLTPSQVQKLIQNYCGADYTEPVSNDILRMVANRVNNNNADDILLLDNVLLEGKVYSQPEIHNVSISKYVPEYIKLKYVDKLLSFADMLEEHKPKYTINF